MHKETTQEKVLREMKAKQAKNGGDVTTTETKVTVPTTFAGLNAGNIKDVFNLYLPVIAQVIPKHLTPERMIQVASVMTARNTDLKNCTAASLINAVVTASMLGLDITPQLGLCAFIPRNNSKTGKKECEFQIQYQGLTQLAWRSGIIKSIETDVVREKDYFAHKKGLNPVLEHIPYEGEDHPGKMIKAWAMVTLTTGGILTESMPRWRIMQHKNFSQAGKSKYSPWNVEMNEHWMWRKTVLKQCLKLAPMSVDQQTPLILDQTVIQDGVIDHKDKSIHLELSEGVSGLLEEKPDKGPPKEQVDPETGEVIPDDIGQESEELSPLFN